MGSTVQPSKRESNMAKLLGIVSIVQESSGERVYLLGIGQTEHDARCAANQWVTQGACDEGVEYARGTLVTFSDSLQTLHSKAYQFADTVDEDGGLVESSRSPETAAFELAEGRLYVLSGVLYAHGV